MKKRIIALLMAIITLFSLCGMLGGCANDDSGKNDSNVVMLNSFENFKRDMHIIKLLNGFGRVEQNDDLQYVKTGEFSMKLRPKGYNFASVPPYIVIPTTSIEYGFDYANFSKVKSFSMWVYNAEQEEIEVGIGLLAGPVTTSQWYSASLNVPGEYFSLKNGWNRLTYEVIPAYLETNSNFSTSEVYGIYIECPYTETFSIEDCPTLYVDDVKLYYGEESTKQLEFNADVEQGVWEIADFENMYESAFFSIRKTGSTNPVYAKPTIKIAQETKYGINADNGSGLLEMTLRAGTGDYGWPAITLDGSVLKAAYANVGQDLLDNPQNYYFEFDLYNCQDFTKSGVTMFMYGADGEQVTSYGRGVSADPLSWTTFSISMDYLCKNDKDYATDPVDYIKNPGNVNFLGSQFATAENTNDRFILFDNFRIVKRITEAE